MTLTPPETLPVSLDGYPMTHHRLPDVMPFTYSSAVGYQRLLETIRKWIPGTLIPYLSTSFGALTDSWETQVNALAAAVDTALASQAATIEAGWTEQQNEITSLAQDAINASAQALLASADASTDPAIMAVLNNVNSQTRLFFDSHYLKSDTGSVDTAVKTALTIASSQSLGFLDLRYAGQIFNDQALDSILENSASVSRQFLEGRFLANTAALVDPAVKNALQVANSTSLALLDGRYLGIAPKSISGTDLNAITKSGNYTGSALTNAPNGQAGTFLISVIYLDSSNQVQFAESLAENFEYRRQMSGGTWGSWRRLVENILATSTALPGPGTAQTKLLLTDLGIEAISNGTAWQIRDWIITLTAAQRAAIPTSLLKYGLKVIESDTGKTYIYTQKWGWVLWDSGDASWTNYTYASGYSNTTSDTASLQWTIRNGVCHIRGLAAGTFASGTEATINTTANVPPAAYLPNGTTIMGTQFAAFGQAAKPAYAKLYSDGHIGVVWQNLGTASAAPAYITISGAFPMGTAN